MLFFITLLLVFILLDLWVWLRLDRVLTRLPNSWIWHWILTCLAVPSMAYITFMIVAFHYVGLMHGTVATWFSAGVFVWHFLVLPVVALILFLHWLAEKVRKKYAATKSVEIAGVSAPVTVPVAVSRRQFLLSSAMIVPPLATIGFTSRGISQIGQFRIQPYEIPLAQLPAELDGFTIAVVADVHTGVFSTPKMLNDIAERTNALRSDLIVMAGDLVNLSHADLPGALDMVCRLDAKYGVYMIQGNHDVIEGAGEFGRACENRGVNLLADDVAKVRARGNWIQLLGARWPLAQSEMVQSINALDAKRDPELFPILLSHHPHLWDLAVPRNIPLTLAGHTHGGQIMLTPNIGGGPIRFKYWTGLYEKKALDGSESKLIVSNGVGNWFPLRINAPAEILQITLRKSEGITAKAR
jgi:hypothetical protein